MTRHLKAVPPAPVVFRFVRPVEQAFPDRLDVRRYANGIVWTRFPEHVERVLKAKALREDWNEDQAS